MRAIYVAGVPVQPSDFNFRSWSVTIGGDRLAALAQAQRAALTVIAFTSAGCAELAMSVSIDLANHDGGNDGLAETDGPDDASSNGAMLDGASGSDGAAADVDYGGDAALD